MKLMLSILLISFMLRFTCYDSLAEEVCCECLVSGGDSGKFCKTIDEDQCDLFGEELREYLFEEEELEACFMRRDCTECRGESEGEGPESRGRGCYCEGEPERNDGEDCCPPPDEYDPCDNNENSGGPVCTEDPNAVCQDENDIGKTYWMMLGYRNAEECKKDRDSAEEPPVETGICANDGETDCAKINDCERICRLIIEPVEKYCGECFEGRRMVSALKGCICPHEETGLGYLPPRCSFDDKCVDKDCKDPKEGEKATHTLYCPKSNAEQGGISDGNGGIAWIPAEEGYSCYDHDVHAYGRCLEAQCSSCPPSTYCETDCEDCVSSSSSSSSSTSSVSSKSSSSTSLDWQGNINESGTSSDSGSGNDDTNNNVNANLKY
jgi:hypothetical protein